MRKNVIFALCIVLVAVLAAAVLLPNRARGAVARVSIADAGSFTLSMKNEGTHAYDTDTGARLPFALEVSEGKVRFVNSACPDHVCEGFGWLEHAYDEAICLPAGVVLRVETAE